MTEIDKTKIDVSKKRVNRSLTGNFDFSFIYDLQKLDINTTRTMVFDGAGEIRILKLIPAKSFSST
ncbi:MAG: hypothetical protein ACXACP_14265, partial [Candidatus Hodarchaeales archaeon]